MRAWSGFRMADVVPLSASGPSAPFGRRASELLASSVLQTWASVGSCGAGGNASSLVVTPTLNGAGGVAGVAGVEVLLLFEADGELSLPPQAASDAARVTTRQ